MKDYLSFNAISYSQPGGTFYACTIPATDIVYRLDVRRRSKDSEAGIQRDENIKRVRDISLYAKEDNAIFPTPIIVSSSSDQIKYENQKILIPKNSDSIGHVLDGQHRLLGLKNLSKSELERFDLLVVFAFDIDIYSEATIFATINSTQKQVSKSLMYDLFSLHPGRSIEKTCHEIVRSLNDDSESPFYKKIKVLGNKVGENETLSQAAFVDQVARQIRSNETLKTYFYNNEDWVIRKIIYNYFSAVEKIQREYDYIFPNDYFFRTSGFGGLTQALGAVVDKGKERQDFSESFMEEIIDNFFNSVQKPPEGVGNSAMLKIKADLIESLSKN